VPTVQLKVSRFLALHGERLLRLRLMANRQRTPTVQLKVIRFLALRGGSL
jgi:hypothetical protein